MGDTKTSILARYFFDLADKIDDLAGSEIAQGVDTFEEEDYGSITATMLDAAYWILASDLGSELDKTPAGLDFYVNSNVYNDLLYRGYTPEWAWDESGLGGIFDLPTDEDVEGPEERTASVKFHTGDYVLIRTEEGVRVGMVISPGVMFAFDGARERIPSNAEGIPKEAAYGQLREHQDAIIASWRVKFEPKH